MMMIIIRPIFDRSRWQKLHQLLECVTCCVWVCVRARVFTGRRKKKRKSGKRNGGIGWNVHAALRSKIHLKLTVAVHFHFFVVSTLLLSFGINNRCMWLTRCASTSLMIYHNCPFCRYLHIWGKWKQLHIVFRNFHFWFSKHPINDKKAFANCLAQSDSSLWL